MKKRVETPSLTNKLSTQLYAFDSTYASGLPCLIGCITVSVPQPDAVVQESHSKAHLRMQDGIECHEEMDFSPRGIFL